MKTDETSRAGIIALQPESEIEQAVVSDLYQRLRAVTEAPEHPSRIGNQLVYYSPACHQYEHLDGDLCRNANIGVTPGGQLNPEPGSRCLVVVHDAELADTVGTVEPTESDADEDETLTGLGGVDEETAASLREAGYESIEHVAAADQDGLEGVEGVSTALAARIKAETAGIEVNDEVDADVAELGDSDEDDTEAEPSEEQVAATEDDGAEPESDELPDTDDTEAGEHIDDPPVSKVKDLLDQMDDEEAGESEDIGPDGLPAPLLGRVTAATGVDNPDYRALQEIALELQEHGVDISANLSTEELLERFEDIHDRNSVTP